MKQYKSQHKKRFAFSYLPDGLGITSTFLVCLQKMEQEQEQEQEQQFIIKYISTLQCILQCASQVFSCKIALPQQDGNMNLLIRSSFPAL
jgi:hypothetical protein